MPDKQLAFATRMRTSALRRMRRLQRSNGWNEVSCRYFGARFNVDLTDLVGFEIATNRFEYHHVDRMLQECRKRKPDLFIDVGANLGLYTCVVGRAQAAKRLIAFEPDPIIFRELQNNIKRNNLTVEAVPVAVGAETGVVRFKKATGENRGLGQVSEDGEDVNCVALDDQLSLSSAIIAIKMDIEGGEPAALKGANKLLSRNSGYAQIEAPDARAPVVIQMMADFGWQLIWQNGLDCMFSKQ
jgi:FkbM family methyltransferase